MKQKNKDNYNLCILMSLIGPFQVKDPINQYFGEVGYMSDTTFSKSRNSWGDKV